MQLGLYAHIPWYVPLMGPDWSGASPPHVGHINDMFRAFLPTSQRSAVDRRRQFSHIPTTSRVFLFQVRFESTSFITPELLTDESYRVRPTTSWKHLKGFS